jgi:hypothetical protein
MDWFSGGIGSPEMARPQRELVEQARLMHHTDTFQCQLCGHLWERPRQIISPPSQT